MKRQGVNYIPSRGLFETIQKATTPRFPIIICIIPLKGLYTAKITNFQIWRITSCLRVLKYAYHVDGVMVFEDIDHLSEGVAF